MEEKLIGVKIFFWQLWDFRGTKQRTFRWNYSYMEWIISGNSDQKTLEKLNKEEIGLGIFFFFLIKILL